MDYAAGKFWLDIAVLIGVAANTLYTWWANRAKVTSRRFAALEKEVAERISKEDFKDAKRQKDQDCAKHKDETKGLEQAYHTLSREVDKLPSRSEIKELSDSMRTLTEKIGNLDGRMSGVNRAVDLINEFLIEQGGKR